MHVAPWGVICWSAAATQAMCANVQNALGPQSLSTLPSSPVSGFGTAKRPSMATKSGVPGPGAYKLKNTVGELKC